MEALLDLLDLFIIQKKPDTKATILSFLCDNSITSITSISITLSL